MVDIQTLSQNFIRKGDVVMGKKKRIREDEMLPKDALRIMIDDPGYWPLIPYLPAKRFTLSKDPVYIGMGLTNMLSEELGVIILGAQTTVVKTPRGLPIELHEVGMSPIELLKKDSYRYGDVEDLIEDGWVVD